MRSSSKKTILLRLYGKNSPAGRVPLPQSMEDAYNWGPKIFRKEVDRILDECGDLVTSIDKIQPNDTIYLVSTGTIVDNSAFDKAREERALTQQAAVRGYSLVSHMQSRSGTAIYNAFHTSAQRPVVIKLVYDKMEVYREKEALKILGDHPYIVPLLDSFTITGSVEKEALVFPKYLVQNCQKVELKRYRCSAAKLAKLSDKQQLSFMTQLVQAVKYCHSKDIIHYDIKPSNILVAEGKELIIVLADFGLAESHEPGACHGYGGTRYYMAPEVLRKEEQTDFAVDMWSVGMVFAEILSDKTLLRGHRDQTESVLRAVESFDKESVLKDLLPTVSPTEFDLLQRLLALDPKKRITAEEALTTAYFVRSQCDKHT